MFALNLYIYLIYGLLHVWFESFVIILVGIYSFNLREESLAYLGVLTGAFAILPPFFINIHKVLESQSDDNGDLKPGTLHLTIPTEVSTTSVRGRLHDPRLSVLGMVL